MKSLIAQLVSRILWDSKAIQAAVDEPFKLASGNFSPIYVNCRVLISDPVAMDVIAALFHWVCRAERIAIDVVAGGETAGIPFAAYLAQRLAKPMAYVRKVAKEHGTRSLVEGPVPRGATAILVEDLITDGRSKLNFARALREEGAKLTHCLVVFDRLQGGLAALQQEGVSLLSLTDMNQALTNAESEKRLAPGAVAEIRAYLCSPREWHRDKGLRFSDET